MRRRRDAMRSCKGLLSKNRAPKIDSAPAEPAATAKFLKPAASLPDLEGMTVGELRDFARMRQIVITGRPRKAELVEVIRGRLQ